MHHSRAAPSLHTSRVAPSPQTTQPPRLSVQQDAQDAREEQRQEQEPPPPPAAEAEAPPAPLTRSRGPDILAEGPDDAVVRGIRAQVAQYEREGTGSSYEENGHRKLRLKAHQHINEAQALQRKDGALLQLSCYSKGTMHALGKLKVGDSAGVMCPRHCHMQSFSAAGLNEDPLSGASSHYTESSLVCFAAQHALGMEVTAATITIAKTDAPVPGETRFGIQSTAVDEGGYGFVASASNSDLKARHKTHLSSEDIDSLHSAYSELSKPFRFDADALSKHKDEL